MPKRLRPLTTGPLRKEGEGYILRTDVEEVVLNCTVLEGNQLVQNLKRDDFQIFEDGVKQNIISFQHTDLAGLDWVWWWITPGPCRGSGRR